MTNTDNTVMTFSSVEALNVKPVVLRDACAHTFKANDDACFLECRPYLMPPGVEGNTQYDHCEAATILLEHDVALGGAVTEIYKANGMTKPQLWKVMERALKVAGFDMARGRVVGILEDKSDRAAEADQVVSEESTHHAA